MHGIDRPQISLDVTGARDQIGPLGLVPVGNRPGGPSEPSAAVGTYAGTVEIPRRRRFGSPAWTRACTRLGAGFDSNPGSHKNNQLAPLLETPRSRLFPECFPAW